ncbi:Alpha-L-fucosidase [Anaerohalosphaera lusitana]|uniref:alpha-L-fucosidase n=1 Tax=Anaerohalosphaera lusitana TaxID=1936003 RepID=A0A1U9NH01_9BACT|nr:alpha-L-fucosidase [Anaerohalosphaera lusitana]AQT67047.1 Alpha-L-fucosidase [Anaerohalosphaera lusitana]
MDRRDFLKLSGAAAGSLMLGACQSEYQKVRAAEVDLPMPTAAQLAWQQAEIGVLVCYELHTFNEDRYVQSRERRRPIKDVNQFNPERLDTDQWVRAVKNMDARFAILTASHESGFRLWQSDVNPYCLKAVEWGRGKRDIVGEFVASCRKYGVKPGIYLGTRWNSHLGVWDFKVTDRSPLTQQEYNELIEKETEEICSRYGDLFELWYDGGAYGPDKGGPDVLSIFEKYQKDCIFYHNHQRADVRWGGSETGTVGYPCWAMMPYDGWSKHNTELAKDRFWLLKHGDADGKVWCPAMSDAPLRNHEWFWEPNDEHKLYSLDALMNMYYKSVGRNSTLILGLTPDTRGLVPDADVERCKELGDEVQRRFGEEIASTSGYGKQVVLELEPGTVINHVVIQEDIARGERIRQYSVEAKQAGQWKQVRKGRSVGHKRIEKFAPVEADAVRLTVLDSVADPLVKRLAVYNCGT